LLANLGEIARPPMQINISRKMQGLIYPLDILELLRINSEE